MDDAAETEEEERIRQANFPWLIFLLIAGGIALVAFSYPLGQLCVQRHTSFGTEWIPEDAERAALVLRCLGGMAFAAGLAERLMSALARGRV